MEGVFIIYACSIPGKFSSRSFFLATLVAEVLLEQ